MLKRLTTLPLAAMALAAPALAQAQNYADLPPLSEAEVRTLPRDMRSAPSPAPIYTGETVTTVNGVETITRTRRIDAPRPAPAAAPVSQGGFAGGYTQGYAAAVPVAATGFYGAAPQVFERQQWIDECRRRTAGQSRDKTGLIIGGLLGAIAGGFAGYEIAGAGDRVLGTALGVGGGGLLGGLIGSLFDGDRKKNRYDCEAALDSYLSTYGAPGARIASREIAYPAPYPAYAAPAYNYGYGYPAGYSYGYTYAPPPQVVLVPVRTEVQQQVVVRESERYETYTVPGAERIIPAPTPRPTPKMIKGR
ncbi:hypothetical protein ACLBKU_05965 [Erythrobacter sp. NE805]|uniref:hypothetical protein n=1 Tax=Erythrobacter sp. NE805 TaxID=3389875 RepID=UPI00396B46A7